jgi:acetolactate synthase-1/2/3 large subunit
LLHCGPGLANGLANLHNARRARSGIVNVVGDQASHHRPLDAPLTADVEGWSRPVSSWVRTVGSPQRLGPDAAEAVRAARISPGGIATLIIPADVLGTRGAQWASLCPSLRLRPSTCMQLGKQLGYCWRTSTS